MQHITIQGVSNIIYALGEMPWAGEVAGEMVLLVADLITNHTDRDAILACQPIHLATLIRALASTDDSTLSKSLRKLRKELKRKHELGLVDSLVFEELVPSPLEV